MEYNFIRVPSIAGNIPDKDIEKIRVDRDHELKSLLHLTIQANENVLLIGERGQGKSFLTILFYRHLILNHPEILPIRIDLTALHFYRNEENFIKHFPALILDQLCKEIWVSLLGNDYSSLLSTYDNTDKINLFQKKSEKRLLEIHSILKKEEQKYRNEFKSIIGGSFGLKGEINAGEQVEWRSRNLQNFEMLELTREIKNTILKEHSRTKIVLICDEANKLAESEQYEILQNYMDFFGANQFNFLLVASNFDKLKSTAEQSGLFRIIEVGGFNSVDLIKELITKSFQTNKFKIENDVYDLIYKAFSGHIRYTLEVFVYCLNELNDEKDIISSKIAEDAIDSFKSRIKWYNKANEILE